MYVCQCDCGTVTSVNGRALRIGNTRSCGCLQREITSKRARLAIKHGMADKHPLYKTWVKMRDRCRNPNHVHYSNYGGRGISICERWDDFALFLADMGEKPGPEYTLDRIDNDGNYEPDELPLGDAI